MSAFTVAGTIVNIFERTFFTGEVVVEEGKIAAVKQLAPASEPLRGPFILPGFTDAHVHIEVPCWFPQNLQNWPWCMVLFPPSAIRMK